MDKGQVVWSGRGLRRSQGRLGQLRQEETKGHESLRRRRRAVNGDCVCDLELEVSLFAVLVGKVAAVIVIVDVLRSLFVLLSSSSSSSSSISSTASPTTLVVVFLRPFLDESWVVVFQLLLESRLALRAFHGGDLIGGSSSSISSFGPVGFLLPG